MAKKAANSGTKKAAAKKVPKRVAKAALPTQAKSTSPRKVADVPHATIDAIHRGERSTRNLVEALAIDPFVVATLYLARAKRIDLVPWLKTACDLRPIDKLPKAVLAIGAAFAVLRNDGKIDDAFLATLASDRSDIVRSFACFALANRKGEKLPRKLRAIRPLAADEHFGVREFAWMALRPWAMRELDLAIRELTKWSRDPEGNVRRFASEITRPCGVWCAHFVELKLHPEQALPILEPLKSDPSEYVRASVGNWLNDASKTRPDFVRDLCDRWRRESPTPETEKICKKALRTISKS